MIERARVQPDARGLERPGIPNRARKEMFTEAVADGVGKEPEVRDLDRAVFGYAAELVPPHERGPSPGDMECDLGAGEMRANLLVGPVPAVAPVIGVPHRAVAAPVQVRSRPMDTLDRQVRKIPEGR